jgi:hypothetical protein
MRQVFVYGLAALCLLASVALASAEDTTPGPVQTIGPLTIDLSSARSLPYSCPPPVEASVLEAPMAHVRQVLQPGDRLDILAVGSASVLGPGANHPELGFAYRMAEALKVAAPQTEVTLTLRGGKGLTAEDSRAALSQAVRDHSYQLILWQTGTIEAMHGLSAQHLFETIEAGAALVRDSSDLILVDPQYSRFLGGNTNIEPYENAIVRAAAEPGVTLFQRFDLMRRWADRGLIDLERAAPADRPATAERLHACLGRALARLVVAGAGMQAAK